MSSLAGLCAIIEYQSFLFKISSTTKPFCSNSVKINSFLSFIIPDVMKIPPSLRFDLAWGINGTIISARILATIISTFLCIPSNKLLGLTSILLLIGFSAKFSLAAVTALSSIS